MAIPGWLSRITTSFFGTCRRHRPRRFSRMLSRRLALDGPALAAISRTTAAQYRPTYGEHDIVLLSADGQAASVQMVNDIVTRIGSPDAHLYAEPGPTAT